MAPRLRDTLLLTLTAAAGSVDAISLIGLERVFTANMTGNLVLLGLAIGQGQLLGSLRSVIAFLCFSVGILAGARVTGRPHETAVWPRRVTLTVGIELALLVVFAAGWAAAGDRPGTFNTDLLIALAAAAMGVQTAAARSLSVPGVATTFVTGTLTSLMAELAGMAPLRSRWTRWAGTLAFLVVGAAAAAAVMIAWRPGAPLVTVLLVGLVAVVGIRKPDE